MTKLEVVMQNIAEFAKITLEELNVLIKKTTTLAIPYTEHSNRLLLKDEEGMSTQSEHEESNNEQERSEEAAASSIRVTTRARVTYELDRFKKNAMLIFAQIRSDPPDGCRIEIPTLVDLGVLVNTFADYRFEVDLYIDNTCSQIEHKCQEFFQRDLSKHGAVVVVVLSYEGTTGKISALDGRFSESIILRHLTNDLNPTIIGKPRIYITEANRMMGIDNGISLPTTDYQDVLGFHLAFVTNNRSGSMRPLPILCKHINTMADTDDFLTIMRKSIEEFKEQHRFLEPFQLELNNTLTKEIRLARS